MIDIYMIYKINIYIKILNFNFQDLEIFSFWLYFEELNLNSLMIL